MEYIFTPKNIAAFRQMRATLPRVLSELAVNFFKDSFKDGGFTDKSLKPWEPRKNERSRYDKDGNKIKFKAKDAESRGVLIKSGKLRRSVGPKYDPNTIGAVSYLPYAEVHNEGGKAGRGKGFQMEQRQFMGDSEKLMADLEKRVFDDLDKSFTG